MVDRDVSRALWALLICVLAFAGLPACGAKAASPDIVVTYYYIPG